MWVWSLIFSDIHYLGLGYHEDLKTRTSFIEVLTSILKQVKMDGLMGTMD